MTAKPGVKVQWKITPEEAKQARRLNANFRDKLEPFYMFAERELLVESLQDSWGGPGPGRRFYTDLNRPLYYTLTDPPVVTDVFLALDAYHSGEYMTQSDEAYFFWEHQKPPEVAISIARRKDGGDFSGKGEMYAALGVRYYIVFDPQRVYEHGLVERFELVDGTYQPHPDYFLKGVGLGLSLWEGCTYSAQETWLRWTNKDGTVIPTKEERDARAQVDTGVAMTEIDRLRGLLRSNGIDPDSKQSGAA